MKGGLFMRTFLCLSCGEIFSEVVENKDYIMGNSYGSLAYLCPKIDCSGNVIEIDDFMISSIRNLNHLGFETLACCSGHSQDSCVRHRHSVRTYILFRRDIFDDFIDDEMIEDIELSLPKGYEIEVDNYENMARFTISKTVQCKSEAECLSAIGLNCSELLTWTENELSRLVEKWIHLEKICDWIGIDEEFIGETESEDFDTFSPKNL